MLENELVRRVTWNERRVDGLVKPEVPRKGGVAVFNDAVIAVASGAFQALTFNSEWRDDADFHSVVANTSRLTVPTGYAGWYTIAGHATFAASGAGSTRVLAISLNAAATLLAAQRAPFSAAITTHITVGTAYYLSAADYVELQAYQDTGGNLNVLAAGNYSPVFRMVRVSR